MNIPTIKEAKALKKGKKASIFLSSMRRTVTTRLDKSGHKYLMQKIDEFPSETIDARVCRVDGRNIVYPYFFQQEFYTRNAAKKALKAATAKLDKMGYGKCIVKEGDIQKVKYTDWSTPDSKPSRVITMFKILLALEIRF